MRTLKFYGASDDLFECEGTNTGIGEPDEINCYDEPCIIEIKTESEGLRIVGEYAVADNACWMIGVAPLDEDQRIPSWPISYKNGTNGYTAELTILTPDDAVVSKVSSNE